MRLLNRKSPKSLILHLIAFITGTIKIYPGRIIEWILLKTTFKAPPYRCHVCKDWVLVWYSSQLGVRWFDHGNQFVDLHARPTLNNQTDWPQPRYLQGARTCPYVHTGLRVARVCEGLCSGNCGLINSHCSPTLIGSRQHAGGMSSVDGGMQAANGIVRVRKSQCIINWAYLRDKIMPAHTHMCTHRGTHTGTHRGTHSRMRAL